MSFDWRDFLAVANFLRNQSGPGVPRDAALRSAVSRAYYAAFCHSRDYAKAKLGYVSPGTPEEHRDLRRFFAQNGFGKIANWLDKLRDWRNLCDYEDPPGKNFAALAENAVNEAARVIAALG